MHVSELVELLAEENGWTMEELYDFEAAQEREEEEPVEVES